MSNNYSQLQFDEAGRVIVPQWIKEDLENPKPKRTPLTKFQLIRLLARRKAAKERYYKQLQKEIEDELKGNYCG